MFASLPLVLGEMVWHYWIAVALALPALGIPVILGLLYLHYVVKPRYGRR
jgi:hypothetical protein